MKKLGLVGAFGAALVGMSFASGATAQAGTDAARLAEVLRLDDVAKIVQEDALFFAGDLLPEDGAETQARWMNEVTAIYDTGWIAAVMENSLSLNLTEDNVATLTDFYASPVGQEIIDLEITARRAIIDPDVEEASKAIGDDLGQTRPSRYEQLTQLIEGLDMVEVGVAGSLNSNLAFMTGLADGGMFEDPPTQADLLDMVWAGEPEIRADIERWLYGYFAMSYETIQDEDLQSYIDLSLSPAGLALDHAINDAYDTIYEHTGRALGLAFARFAGASEL